MIAEKCQLLEKLGDQANTAEHDLIVQHRKAIEKEDALGVN